MERMTERDEHGEALLKAGVYIPDVIDKLCAYEDLGVDPDELDMPVLIMNEIPEDKLAEIRKAFQENRLVLKAGPLLDTCGTCLHFQREDNTAHGHCDCRTDKYFGHSLYVTQGRKRCRYDYLSKRGWEERNNENQTR